MSLTTAIRPQRRRLMRFSAERQLKPLTTFDCPPTAVDADGNGIVAAYMHGTWSAEGWRYVAEHPMSAPYWIPLSSLPIPGAK